LPEHNPNLKLKAALHWRETMPFFFTSLWPALIVWVVLYISDYAFTIACAKMRRGPISEKIVIEGSYEITPYFQRDVDALRRFSPRFVTMLVYSTLLLVAVWFLSAQSFPEFFAFAAGAMILIEVTIHIRHLKNFLTYRRMKESDCVRGRIEYSRAFILRTSADELFVFAGIYALFFVPTLSWFLLGGVASCLSVAMKHRRLAQKAEKAASSMAPAAAQPNSTT
jgi:hypothetical protein